MDSSFDLRSFDLLDLDPMRISEVVSGFTEGRLPLVLALAAVFLAWSFSCPPTASAGARSGA